MKRLRQVFHFQIKRYNHTHAFKHLRVPSVTEAIRMCMGCQCRVWKCACDIKTGFGECDKPTGEAEL